MHRRRHMSCDPHVRPMPNRAAKACHRGPMHTEAFQFAARALHERLAPSQRLSQAASVSAMPRGATQVMLARDFFKCEKEKKLIKYFIKNFIKKSDKIINDVL